MNKRHYMVVYIRKSNDPHNLFEIGNSVMEISVEHDTPGMFPCPLDVINHVADRYKATIISAFEVSSTPAEYKE